MISVSKYYTYYIEGPEKKEKQYRINSWSYLMALYFKCFKAQSENGYILFATLYGFVEMQWFHIQIEFSWITLYSNLKLNEKLTNDVLILTKKNDKYIL